MGLKDKADHLMLIIYNMLQIKGTRSNPLKYISRYNLEYILKFISKNYFGTFYMIIFCTSMNGMESMIIETFIVIWD